MAPRQTGSYPYRDLHGRLSVSRCVQQPIFNEQTLQVSPPHLPRLDHLAYIDRTQVAVRSFALAEKWLFSILCGMKLMLCSAGSARTVREKRPVCGSIK